MEELQILATLIQHADQQIDVGVNTFLTLMGVVAVFTMTETYNKNWNWVLKILLSIGLTVLLWANRDGIIAQMEIYNALIQDFPDDVEPWLTLFGDHGVYQKIGTTSMFWVHAIASWVIHVMVWQKELKEHVGRRVKVWWTNWKRRRPKKRLG